MPSERSPGQGGRTLAVAALQSAPVVGDPEATLRAFTEQVRDVAATFPFVRLLIAPELLLEAEPPFPRTATAREPSLIPGEATGRLGRLARETGLWLLPGTLYEAGEDGRVYNTAPVFSPDGEIAARYRKVFPGGPSRPPRRARSSSSSTSPARPGSTWRSASTGTSPRPTGSRPGGGRGRGPTHPHPDPGPHPGAGRRTGQRHRQPAVRGQRQRRRAHRGGGEHGDRPRRAGPPAGRGAPGGARRRARHRRRAPHPHLRHRGVSRPLVLLAERDRPVPLPAYGGALSAPPWARDHLDHPRHEAEERP
ncbi:carbon-nitrogen hydrolase family protein [Nocardiopsis composta]